MGFTSSSGGTVGPGTPGLLAKFVTATTIGDALANAAGVLTNDGAGNYSWGAPATADRWNALTAPNGNATMAHANYTTVFTWGAATGALTDMWTLQDTALNTGTGSILAINVAAGSAASPLSLASGQWKVDSAGDMVNIKNLPYSWPIVHAVASVLQNDGGGLLAWAPLSGLTVGAAGYATGAGTAGYATGAGNLRENVINQTLGNIPAGPVTIVGYDSVSGMLSIVQATSAATADLFTTLLLAPGAMHYGYRGDSVLSGVLNTAAAALGDPVYLSAAGGLTLTDPSIGSPTNVQQVIGRVRTVAVAGDVIGTLGLTDGPARLNLTRLPRGLAAGGVLYCPALLTDTTFTAAATTVDAAADLLIGASAAAKKPLVVQGLALQTANLFEAQASTGAVLGQWLPDGRMEFAPGAATGLANAERTDFYWNLNRTLTFTGGAGAIANMRACRVTAPTYAAALAQTITSAATFSISGPPVVGANVAITSPKAFEVESGESWFQGDVRIWNATDPFLRIGNRNVAATTGKSLDLDYAIGTSLATISSSDSGAAVYTPLIFCTSQLRMFNGFAANEFVLGRDNIELQPGILRASNGSGANVAGTVLTLSAGAGTGTAASGNLVYSVAPAGGAGAAVNTRIDALKFNCIDPVAFTAVADIDGIDAVFRTQSGGAATSPPNPRGGDFKILLGAGGAGGTGRAGYFDIAAGKFQVDVNGNLIKVNNVALSWPAANASGLLKNDGSGNLSWLASASYPTGSILLTEAATIAINATLGNYFYVTLTASRALGVPTGGVDGQIIRIEVAQDGTGGWSLTTVGWLFGTDITGITLTATASKRDVITAIYSTRAAGWMITGFVKGYA